MTVEENLLMGGYIKDKTEESFQEAERILEKYERLRNRRNQPAKVLSGGERRLLEISRALVMKPSVLLVDEPSIGLEPRYIDMVFEILRDLQQNEKKTIILVEQNAKKGLEFADIGYVLVSGQTAIASKGDELLQNPDVGIPTSGFCNNSSPLPAIAVCPDTRTYPISCLLYTSPSPRDVEESRMPSSA